MDSESQKKFNEIVAKAPEALFESDIVFLKARSSYLSEDQRQKFAAVLEDPKEETETEAKPAKKKKPDDE